MTGRIKWYKEQAHYGFLATDDGIDAFFHESSILGDYIPKEGDYVSFDIVETDKGKAARDVALVE